MVSELYARYKLLDLINYLVLIADKRQVIDAGELHIFRIRYLVGDKAAFLDL